jgi:hypothetical protein
MRFTGIGRFCDSIRSLAYKVNSKWGFGIGWLLDRYSQACYITSAF